MANSMERLSDLSARPSESAADREAIFGSRKQIGVWLVSAAIAFLSLGLFGLRLVPARYDLLVVGLGISALLAMVLSEVSWKPAAGSQDITPQLVGEIQSQIIRPSSTRNFAGERMVETEILLKLSVRNLSPVPAEVVGWILRVEVAGKACHVQGPLYLAENEFGPPEAKWNRLESVHHEAGWPDEFSSWCEVIAGKPVVGWLAFYVQRVSAADLENAKLTLQMMDSTGRLYEAPRQSTRLAA